MVKIKSCWRWQSSSRHPGGLGNYLYKIWFTSICSDSCFPIPSYHLLESHTAWDVMRVRICSGKWKESHISGWWANKIVYQCILVWNGVKWRKSHLCGWLANSGVPSHAGWSYRPKHTGFRFMNLWQKTVETFLSKKYYAKSTYIWYNERLRTSFNISRPTFSIPWTSGTEFWNHI